MHLLPKRPNGQDRPRNLSSGARVVTPIKRQPKEIVMRTLLLAAATAAATLAIAAPAGAQRNNWRTIAYTTVGAGTDRDVINVRGNNRYREVRLCSFNAPIRMRDFDIRFDNGGRQDVRVRQRIGAGACTRNVDLEGNRRDIERIRLIYERLARGARRPLIRVQAR
jgi:hypothetical protein